MIVCTATTATALTNLTKKNHRLAYNAFVICHFDAGGLVLVGMSGKGISKFAGFVEGLNTDDIQLQIESLRKINDLLANCDEQVSDGFVYPRLENLGITTTIHVCNLVCFKHLSLSLLLFVLLG